MTVHSLSPLIDSVVRMNLREDFANMTGSSGATGPAFFLLLLAILAVDVGIIYWLWNHVIVNVITIAKPIKSVWTAAGLLLFLLIVHS
jgi:hypothetical protein